MPGRDSDKEGERRGVCKRVDKNGTGWTNDRPKSKLKTMEKKVNVTFCLLKKNQSRTKLFHFCLDDSVRKNLSQKCYLQDTRSIGYPELAARSALRTGF